MKNLTLICASIMMLSATSCGTMKLATQDVQNPIKAEWRTDTNTKLRAVGMGDSPDLQIAINKAYAEAQSKLAEKINSEVNVNTSNGETQTDVYEDEGKDSDVAKTYKRVYTEKSHVILNREITQLDEQARYDKKSGRYYVWVALETSKKDKKEAIKNLE